MNQIKIIKKNLKDEEPHPPETAADAIPKSGFRHRETVQIVEDWVAAWQRRKEMETRRSLTSHEEMR